MSSQHPDRPIPSRSAWTASAVAACLFGIGCSGDEREFVEAIEVDRAGLEGLEIVAPADYEGLDLALAPGESLDLDVAGRGAAGVAVEIDGDDREWTVRDDPIGRIDRDGRFVAIADGVTTVGLEIGGVRAQPLQLTVSSMPITEVSELRGPDAPDPCAVARYVAIGTFDDGTRRLLGDTAWSVVPGAGATATAAPLLRDAGDAVDGAVELVPRSPEDVVLRAEARGERLDTTLDVQDSLRGIAFEPNALPLTAGQSRELRVFGSYGSAGGDDTRAVDITDVVDFSVDESDADFGSVSNVDGSRGRFEAIGQGIATVRATCGVYEAPAIRLSVGAGGSTPSGTGGLALELDGRDVDSGDDTEISLSGNGTAQQGNAVRLRVSTGTSFDDDDEITDEVRVISSDEDVLDVSVGSDSVLLIPVSLGFARVTVSRGVTEATLDVDVVL